ncbi:MAG: class I SAM-dependent rRNA methyltransferase [Gammaproteobacteria bacterium]|nr:class I SAM-dependent rRNA methyltransferase [Gammaproteobacteria bacterium]MCP4881561.1 class I SAM-dependent rRNA methyltransferase [Gammaproteobacteria bacterium]
MAHLILKPKADRRLRNGHLWIYSNEVDVAKTPLAQFMLGQQVDVLDHKGKPLGTAMVNPQQLICGRLVNRRAGAPLTQADLVIRLQCALRVRESLFAAHCYRWVYGDSDGLPGLVIDRFGDTVVVQVSLAGMEILLEPLIDAINEVQPGLNILLKNDGKMRQIEGLEEYVRTVQGEVPKLVPLQENGVQFVAPVWHGQKTGWFYDHRLNRARVQALSAGKRVLDLFSYVGGWGIQAGVAGASEVVCVDASASALELVHQQAKLNDIAARVRTIKGDAFAALKQLNEDGERFDVVILDPPAFISRRKDIKTGELAYQRANQLAMRLVANTGYLVSASCSMHLERKRLVDVVNDACRKNGRHGQILEHGGQGGDHPVHPAIPETEYLKSIIVGVNPGF